jgi:hypothetical protein
VVAGEQLEGTICRNRIIGAHAPDQQFSFWFDNVWLNRITDADVPDGGH